MKGQFAFLFTAFILLAVLVFSVHVNLPYRYYEINMAKYIAYNFYLDVLKNATLANKTYYNYCKSIGIYCIYNGTAVIVKTLSKVYIIYTR